MELSKFENAKCKVRLHLNYLTNLLVDNFFFRNLKAKILKRELLALLNKSKFLVPNESDPINLKIIELFALTSGHGLDQIASVLEGDKIAVTDRSKLFFAHEQSIGEIALEIRKKGYYAIESVIPKEVCEQVVSFALNTKSYPRASSDQVVAFEPCLPIEPYLSARYDFYPNFKLIFENQFLQELIFDPFIFNVAQEYLGGRPYLDPIDLWWLFPFEKRDSNWAEDFHFDMDTIKWLKFFINFEEIKISDGPHIFLEGTHRSDILPWELLKKRYKRLSDEEVFNALPHIKERKFIVPAGSLLIEDTRGLHKGLPSISGRRLMFSIQYSNVYCNLQARTKIDNLGVVTEVMKSRLKNSLNSYDGYFSHKFINSIRG